MPSLSSFLLQGRPPSIGPSLLLLLAVEGHVVVLHIVTARLVRAHLQQLQALSLHRTTHTCQPLPPAYGS